MSSFPFASVLLGSRRLFVRTIPGSSTFTLESLSITKLERGHLPYLPARKCRANVVGTRHFGLTHTRLLPHPVNGTGQGSPPPPQSSGVSQAPTSVSGQGARTNPRGSAGARYGASRDEMYRKRNQSLLMYTSAVIIGAIGVTYAAVPLYRAFCAATGFAGTPVVGTGRFEPERLVPVENARRIKVHFNADSSEQLPWTFVPQQRSVSVLPGETSLAFYRAKNDSDKDIIGIATYNVTPDRIAPYFAKVECFCFEEQKLLAGEEVDMPLLFFIDKDILDDPTCRHVDDVVLSYTFFKARRNQQGHLEPDAADSVVQAAMGFDKYEHAPKKENRI